MIGQFWPYHVLQKAWLFKAQDLECHVRAVSPSVPWSPAMNPYSCTSWDTVVFRGLKYLFRCLDAQGMIWKIGALQVSSAPVGSVVLFCFKGLPQQILQSLNRESLIGDMK